MNAPGLARVGPHLSCHLCADEGRVGRVVQESGDGTIMVEFAAGDFERVAADLIDAPRAGDVVLVHMGFAITRVEGS